MLHPPGTVPSALVEALEEALEVEEGLVEASVGDATVEAKEALEVPLEASAVVGVSPTVGMDKTVMSALVAPLVALEEASVATTVDLEAVEVFLTAGVGGTVM